MLDDGFEGAYAASENARPLPFPCGDVAGLASELGDGFGGAPDAGAVGGWDLPTKELGGDGVPERVGLAGSFGMVGASVEEGHKATGGNRTRT